MGDISKVGKFDEYIDRYLFATLSDYILWFLVIDIKKLKRIFTNREF